MRKLSIRMDAQIAVLAVAEKGSFEAAGDYLGITKSAVRKQVNSIADELGVPLFRLDGSQLALTEAGSAYLPNVRANRSGRRGIDRVLALARMQAGELRIGYCTYLPEKLLEAIARFEPAESLFLGIRRESMLTPCVIDRVARGDLHLGFRFLPLRVPELEAQPLMEEPLIACIPPGHSLAAKSILDPEDLEGQPIVATARKVLPGVHAEIVAHFESLGVSLRVAADAFLPKEALWIVRRGVDIALMTRSAAAVAGSEIALRPFSDRLLTVKSGYFLRRDRLAGSIQEFLDRVQRRLQSFGRREEELHRIASDEIKVSLR